MNFWKRFRRALTVAVLAVGGLSAATALWLTDAPAKHTPPAASVCLTNCL